MDDELIVSMYWNRNEDAISETHKKYGPYLFKTAWNILFDTQDCEEAVSETTFRTWNSIPTDRPSILKLYLAKITRQLAIDIYRAKNALKRKQGQYSMSLDELSDIVPDSSSVDEDIDHMSLCQSIERFLRLKSEDQRKMFIRRYFFFDPISDISKSLGVSQSAVKTSLFRLRKDLKSFLEKEGYRL